MILESSAQREMVKFHLEYEIFFSPLSLLSHFGALAENVPVNCHFCFSFEFY